ncbi:zinc ribbon domain-containing protein [Streptomyces sp. NPDC021096]|uniref:zinc ribbon domain-containing protein n=1 Tax=Streptomyces sp. NPDC021096 TaxID=3154792 RepID=UPI003410CAD5
MPSFCPACGSAFEPDARFCMKCGKERPEAERAAAGATAAGTATAPVMPPSPPPPAAPPAPPGQPPLPGAPPGYAPYAPPSRGALFLRRAFTGDWAGSAKAAAWPTALLLVLALVISLPSPGDYEELGLTSWSDRFPAAIGLLLQGLGATLEVETRSGGGLLTMLVRGSGSVSVWPLTITALWAGAVALGAKRLRRTLPAGSGGSGGGAEATLRIALICAGAVLLLGLYGQPDLEIVSVSTTPVLAALFSGALAGVVSGAVLCRDAVAARLGAGAQLAVRAWGTALRALGLSVALCGVIVFFVIASHPDETGDWAWAGSLPFLINLGLMALGLSWGAGVEGSSTEHGRHTGETLGLSEIGDLAGGWAQTGAVAAGVACAVILAVTVARRSADRTEQVLSGIFFLATLWLLSFVSGGAMEMTTGTSFSSRSQGTDGSVATNAGELLLFGLLWTAGALLLATALTHPRGPASTPRTAPSAPPAPPAQPVPPMPPMPTAGAQPMPSGGAQSMPTGGAQPTAPTAQPAWPPAAPAAAAAPAAGAQAADSAASAAGQAAARPVPPAGAQSVAPSPTVKQPASPAGAQLSSAAGQAAAQPAPPAGAQPPSSAAQPAAQPAPAGGPAGAQTVAHSVAHPSAPAAQPAPFAAHPAGPATAQYDAFAPAPSPHSSFAHLTVPGPVPAAPARSVRRPLMWVAIGLAAFLVGGAATAGVMLLGNGKNSGGGEDAKAPASQSQAPSGGATGGDGASGAPSAGPSPSASARPGSKPRPPKGEPPKGYQRMTSPEGFSLAVPESWQRENKGTNQIDYAGPTGPGHIRVGIVPNAGASAYDHFQEMEKSVGKQEGYQRVQMTANTFMGRPGALWEWTWREKNGEVMHALNQAYVDENGTEYAVMYSERERFYPDARKVFDTALQFWWVGPYGVS